MAFGALALTGLLEPSGVGLAIAGVAWLAATTTKKSSKPCALKPASL